MVDRRIQKRIAVTDQSNKKNENQVKQENLLPQITFGKPYQFKVANRGVLTHFGLVVIVFISADITHGIQ